MIDLIVIGAGSGGLAAAKRAAGAGKSVVLIENDSIGGTCVTYGCVPKKLWHAISQFRHQANVASHHGWSCEPLAFDWGGVQKRLSDYVTSLNQRHEQTCLDLGIQIIRGTARIASPTSIEVNGAIIQGQRILITVGGKAVRLPIPGGDLCDTSYEFFSWPHLPKSVVIWGGGYIAVELASILNALGTAVDLVIRQDRVLRGFDDDLRQYLQDRYLDRGIRIHAKTAIASVKKADNQLLVTCENGMVFSTEKVIQAVGRVPFTDPLNCQNVGIKTTQNGAIIINDQYQTSVPSIFALGDCIDQVQLTPVAIAQAREWVDLALLNKKFPVDYTFIPTAVFSHPEAATIGKTEVEANATLKNVTVKTLKFNPLTMALTEQHKEPIFIKLILEGDDENIVGIHLSCDGAAEIIQSLAIAMQKGITRQDLDLTMALHPSIMEELVTMQ
jgi:glutathione reductase (NADPH)